MCDSDRDDDCALLVLHVFEREFRSERHDRAVTDFGGDTFGKFDDVNHRSSGAAGRASLRTMKSRDTFGGDPAEGQGPQGGAR